MSNYPTCTLMPPEEQEGNLKYYRIFSLPRSKCVFQKECDTLQILLSRTQAGPGRTVKQQQEEISPNHIQSLNLISVHGCEIVLPGPA